MSVAISAKDVKALRERTGAGMMDCKAALQEAGGDIEKAVEILRVKGQASAAKRGGRGAAEGVVSSYVHANGKIGVLVEVDCETDFVARTEPFQEFAREVARARSRGRAAVRVGRGSAGGGQGGRAARAARAGGERGQAGERAGEDRGGPPQEVARGGRAPRPDARERGEARRQDDRGSSARSSPRAPARTWSSGASRASRSARSERQPSGASCSSCRARRSWGTCPTGPIPTRIASIAEQVKTVADRGVEVAIVVGGGNIYRGMAGAAAGNGPRHRRLHGHARHGAERAGAAGRPREDRRRDARAVGDRDLGGGRALHPPQGHAPPRARPHRDLRGRHGQPVLHDRHGGGAARARDARRGHPDGQERGGGRLHGRPAQGSRTRSSSTRSPTGPPSSNGSP